MGFIPSGRIDQLISHRSSIKVRTGRNYRFTFVRQLPEFVGELKVEELELPDFAGELRIRAIG